MVPHGDIHQRVSLLCFHQPSILRSQSQPSRRSSASALRSSCGSVGEDPDETERSEEEEGEGSHQCAHFVIPFQFLFQNLLSLSLLSLLCGVLLCVLLLERSIRSCCVGHTVACDIAVCGSCGNSDGRQRAGGRGDISGRGSGGDWKLPL
jgi:hypothetical protein